PGRPIGQEKGRNLCCCLGFRPLLRLVGRCIGGGGGSRTRVRRRLTPGTTCLAYRWISFPGSTVGKAHPETSLLDLAVCRQAAAVRRSRDNDPTPTSTSTSGFGARP